MFYSTATGKHASVTHENVQKNKPKRGKKTQLSKQKVKVFGCQAKLKIHQFISVECVLAFCFDIEQDILNWVKFRCGKSRRTRKLVKMSHIILLSPHRSPSIIYCSAREHRSRSRMPRGCFIRFHTYTRPIALDPRATNKRTIDFQDLPAFILWYRRRVDVSFFLARAGEARNFVHVVIPHTCDSAFN